VLQAYLELLHQYEVRRGITREGFAVTVDGAGKSLHVIPQFELVMIN
jgi:hypothetical protein